MALLGVGKLEDRAADARDAVARCLGDIALGQGPQAVEGSGEGTDSLAYRSVAPSARSLGEIGERAQQAHGLEELAHESRPALKRQGDHGDAPTVVLLTHPVVDRDANLVKEEFCELG